MKIIYNPHYLKSPSEISRFPPNTRPQNTRAEYCVRPFFEVAIIIAQTTAKVYRFDINFFQNIFLHNRKIKLLFILKYIRIECDPLRAERCQSGLMCPLGKRVYRKVSEVRILSSPPAKGIGGSNPLLSARCEKTHVFGQKMLKNVRFSLYSYTDFMYLIHFVTKFPIYAIGSFVYIIISTTRAVC